MYLFKAVSSAFHIIDTSDNNQSDHTMRTMAQICTNYSWKVRIDGHSSACGIGAVSVQNRQVPPFIIFHWFRMKYFLCSILFHFNLCHSRFHILILCVLRHLFSFITSTGFLPVLFLFTPRIFSSMSNMLLQILLRCSSSFYLLT